MGTGRPHKSQIATVFKEAPDLLSLVVKAHYSIDELLNALLGEALPNADAVELKRVSFLLKADFAIGLGMLRSDLRPVFNRINAVRNSFAHNPYSDFSDKDVGSTVTILLAPRPKVVPDDFARTLTPRNVLETLLAVGFINLSVAYERFCLGKAQARVANQMAREVIVDDTRSERERRSVQEEFEERLRSHLNEHYPGIAQS